MKAIPLGLSVVLLLIFCLVDIETNSSKTFLLPRNSENFHKEIQYSYSLINTKNKVLSHAEMWCFAPVLSTSLQEYLDIEVSHPYEMIVDRFGNQIIHFTFSDIPPFSTKIINIKSNLKVSSKPKQTELGTVSLFLQPEEFIQSDNPEIVQIANNLKNEDQLQTVVNIFTWITNEIRYIGYVKNARGALQALRSKKGDCTEFVYLFVALCRANGIPARPTGGYICHENCVLRPELYHNWAAFYHNGAWQIADPQKKVFMEKESQYIAMKSMGQLPGNPLEDFQRLRVIGEGLNVRMN